MNDPAHKLGGIWELYEREEMTMDAIEAMDRLLETNQPDAVELRYKLERRHDYLDTIDQEKQTFFEDQWDEITGYLRADGMNWLADE